MKSLTLWDLNLAHLDCFMQHLTVLEMLVFNVYS